MSWEALRWSTGKRLIDALALGWILAAPLVTLAGWRLGHAPPTTPAPPQVSIAEETWRDPPDSVPAVPEPRVLVTFYPSHGAR